MHIRVYNWNIIDIISREGWILQRYAIILMACALYPAVVSLWDPSLTLMP